jgi:hypothetical protein
VNPGVLNVYENWVIRGWHKDVLTL